MRSPSTLPPPQIKKLKRAQEQICSQIIKFYENHPFPGKLIEMETSLEVLCIRIMTDPQVFGQKCTPIRRFLGCENSPILAAHP